MRKNFAQLRFSPRPKHIKRVRKKFRQADEEFNQIETLYGIGYRYKEQ